MRTGTRTWLWIVAAYAAGCLSGLYGPRQAASTGPEIDRLQAQNVELSAALEAAQSQRSRLQTELSHIAEVDLADYLRLRREEDQFQKAKEILGKVFLVLFHNLLQDLPRDQVEFARSAAGSQPENNTESAPQPAAPPVGAEKKSDGTGPLASAKTPQAVSWNQAEKDLAQLNPGKADAFLKSVVIQDVASETKGYRTFQPTDTRLTALQSTYAGEITFLDPRKKPWNLEMTLNSEIKEGVPSGSFAVRITQDNGSVSNHSGNGSLRNIIQPVSPSRALIVRLTDTSFLQMYILENQETIIGNYYDEVQVGKVEPVGRFRLQR